MHLLEHLLRLGGVAGDEVVVADAVALRGDGGVVGLGGVEQRLGLLEPLYMSSRRWYDPFSRMSIFGVMRSSTLAASALRPRRISVIHCQSLVAVIESSLFDTFMHST